MGCIEDTAVAQNSIGTLKNLVHRIKISSEIDRARQMGQLQGYEQLLIAEFSKPVKARSCQLQHSMIKNNLTFYATTAILMMVENHAKILLQHKNYFDNKELLQKVKTSLNLLLYCSSILGKEDLHQFGEVFRKTYPDFPFPSDNDMDPFVREFKTSRKVSVQRQTEYIFQFCNKYSISAERINQAGHSYKYK